MLEYNESFKGYTQYINDKKDDEYQFVRSQDEDTQKRILNLEIEL